MNQTARLQNKVQQKMSQSKFGERENAIALDAGQVVDLLVSLDAHQQLLHFVVVRRQKQQHGRVAQCL